MDNLRHRRRDAIRHLCQCDHIRLSAQLSCQPILAISVLAALLAIFASRAIGADHPVWADMGVLAVMQGQHLHLHLVRSLQRVAGTVLGAMLGLAVAVVFSTSGDHRLLAERRYGAFS